MTTIRLALAPVENAAEAYYARDMGFFAKAGIDADLQPMQAVWRLRRRLRRTQWTSGGRPSTR